MSSGVSRIPLHVPRPISNLKGDSKIPLLFGLLSINATWMPFVEAMLRTSTVPKLPFSMLQQEGSINNAKASVSLL